MSPEITERISPDGQADGRPGLESTERLDALVDVAGDHEEATAVLTAVDASGSEVITEVVDGRLVRALLESESSTGTGDTTKVVLRTESSAPRRPLARPIVGARGGATAAPAPAPRVRDSPSWTLVLGLVMAAVVVGVGLGWLLGHG